MASTSAAGTSWAAALLLLVLVVLLGSTAGQGDKAVNITPGTNQTSSLACESLPSSSDASEAHWILLLILLQRVAWRRCPIGWQLAGPLLQQQKKPLPPVYWRWVEDGGLCAA
jgi:hypothetical protein